MPEAVLASVLGCCRAEAISSAFTCRGFSSGKAVQTSAAAPATAGEAIEVPVFT